MLRLGFLLALASFPHGGAQAQQKSLRITTLGDSITKGVRRGVTAEQTFAKSLEGTLTQNGIHATVNNVGIGGERTDQALQRLDKDVISHSPHVVTIMYGTNDGYIDPGKSASRLPLDRYEANLREMIARLTAANVHPVLMTAPMFGEQHRKNGLGEDPNVRLAPYAEACRRVASDTNTPLVDHFAHWAAVQARKARLQDWTTDGCHPNPAGHAEMAHRIAQVVLPLAQRLADQHGAWRDDARLTLQLDTVTRGYDGKMCWVHPRAGAIPGSPPSIVLTMQRLLLSGSDVFYALNDLRTDDLGASWSELREHADALGRRSEAGDVVVAACDFWPKWHAKSGRLLGIGHNARYRNNAVIHDRQRETVYSVYDERQRAWTPWTALAMPDDPKFSNNGAGCVQRVDLPSGDILLPIYFKAKTDRFYKVTVLRCTFDGATLRFVEQGNELTVNIGRGLYEPSLARFRNRFFLTMRNDEAGYVSTSTDGLHYSEPRRWTWEDGTELGTYNTQHHWVAHRDALHLAYTRKGANNDHIFRHRAPLFMGQIDPEKLAVMRATERILVPERGARLGNFGVTEVNENETWVTVAEWMQTFGPNIIIPVDNPYHADNSVYAARIRWRTPNTDWDKH